MPNFNGECGMDWGDFSKKENPKLRTELLKEVSRV